jgi:hypothetical protein
MDSDGHYRDAARIQLELDADHTTGEEEGAP